MRLRHAACLLLATAASAAAAAAKQQATCKINIQGFGNSGKTGVANADVQCTTSDGKPLVVGVSSSYMPSWSERFSPGWAGVTVEQDLPCSSEPDASPTSAQTAGTGPLNALLYFCGDYELLLNQPVVQGLKLKADAFASEDGGQAGTGAKSPAGLESTPGTSNDADSRNASKTAKGDGLLPASGAESVSGNGSDSGGAAAGLKRGRRGLLVRGLLQGTEAASLGSQPSIGSSSSQVDSYAGPSTFVRNYANIVSSVDTKGSGGTPGSSGTVDLDTILSAVTSDSGISQQIATAINNSQVQLGVESAVLLFGGGVRANVTGGTFTDTQHSGSMLHVDGHGLVADTSVVVRNCSFVRIVAQRHAAIRATHGGQVSIQGCKFEHNTVIASGGAVGARDSDTYMHVVESTFAHNRAALSAGAVYAGFGGKINVSSSVLLNNSASQMGGALFAEYGSVLTLSDYSKVSKSVGGLGGAIACDYAVVYMSNGAVLNDNFAKAGGGAFLADCVAEFIDSSVIDNVCDISGGAGIDFRGSCVFSLVNATVAGNVALMSFDSAGGLYGSLKPPATSDPESFEMWRNPIIVTLEETGNLGSILLQDSLVSGNQGDTGGFQVPENYTVVIKNTQVVTNAGNTSGGMLSFGNLSVEGGLMFENFGFYGGAINIKQGYMLCVGCSMVSNYALLDGGAVYAENDAIVLLGEGARILANTAMRNGGGILLRDDAYLDMEDSTISGNAATGDNSVRVALGGGVMLTGRAFIDIQSSHIHSNTAQSGGGVYAMEQATVFVDKGTRITNNTAQSGGGIAFEGANLTIVANSSVTNNLAHIQAGGIMLQSGAFDAAQLSRAVYNNSAPFHVNVGVTPTNITISNKSPNHAGVVALLSDSGVVPLLVNVTGTHGIPCDGEAMIATVERASTGQSFTIVNISQINGGAWFELALAPGSYSIVVSHKFNQSVPPARLHIELQACNPGQIVSAHTGLCQVCPNGAFSFTPGSSSCEQCPVGAECPGGAVMLVRPGFWRSSQLSDQVHRCANPLACGQSAANNLTCTNSTGNLPCTTSGTTANHSQASDLMDSQCSSGYEGNMCGVCTPGYGTNKPFGCRKCMKQNVLVASFVIAAVLLLLMIKGLCHFTIKGATQKQHTTATRGPQGTGVQATGFTRALGQCLTTNGPELQPTDLLKSLVLYFQYLLIIASLNIEWPVSMLYPFQALAWLFSSASPETLSVDCLFTREAILPLAIQKTLFYLAMPLVMLCVLLLFEVLMYCWASANVRNHQRRGVVGHRSGSLADLLLSYGVVVLFFFLPSLARTTFSLFACVSLDNPAVSAAEGPADSAYAAVGKFWMLDMNQQCYYGYHKTWSLALGMPLLFLLCIAVPAVVLGLTVHSRRRAQRDPAYMCHYSFLSEPYKSSLCFWEGVLALQTQGLVAISVFGSALGPYYQTIVMHTAIACYCY